MSSTLKEVVSCCNTLKSSSKVTQRRDALKRLKALLDVSTVIQSIDACTTAELQNLKDDSPVQWSWSDVVSSLLSGIQSEWDSAGTGRKPSAKSSSKKEGPEMLRYVVKLADGRGPKLFNCVKEIVQHIVNALEDDTLNSIVGNEYSYILLDSISSVGSYCHLFTRQSFNDLLKLYTTRLLSEPMSQFDPILHARTLSALISKYPFDLTPFYPKLHQFFELFFSHELREPKILSILFTGLNRLLLACAVNCRANAKALGETLTKFILSKWSISNNELKV